MCKAGDIIVVDKYIGEDGKNIGKHSFIVVDDNADIIKGIPYTFVTNVISSFKNEKHKERKLNFREDLEIIEFEKNGKKIKPKKDSYIKEDQLIYFNKSKIDYYILGKISDELFDKLILLIMTLNKKGKLKNNVKNLK